MGCSIRPLTAADHDALFESFARIVHSGEGFPQAPPLTRPEFDDYWIAHSRAVWVADVDGEVVGAYYLKSNFVGRASHIANGGYFLDTSHRGRGLGATLVEHSIVEARRLGFRAMQFNLVFASNPARALYERFGFREIGRIPDAVDGEEAIIYWLAL